MITVPPDGPVPCDLAVVGESPGRQEEEEGRGFCGPSGGVLWARPDYPNDMGLMEVVAQRPRATCYVSNVCKESLPEDEWRMLSAEQRGAYEQAVLAELDAVGVRLVLAFGVRAARTLVPGFVTMTIDHGKATLGPTGKWLAMGLYHPASYLRGNREALGAIAADLAQVETLLLEGLVELVQPLPPAPEPTWVPAIGFMAFDGLRKTAQCRVCGTVTPKAQKGRAVASYTGEGLTWKLCMEHAERTAAWAADHADILKEHRDIERRHAEQAKAERAAAKMEAEYFAAQKG